MSRKRAKPNPHEDVESSIDRLRTIVDVKYDREQIDALLEQYRSDECAVSDSSKEMVCCPRSYEETFLREPVGSERLCARNEFCEGLQLHCESPFVLREFLYPGQECPEARALCLLCRREEISGAFYRYETGHAHGTHNLRITDHYNMVGIPGEYDVRDCIVSSGKYTGLPLPVVLHVRSAYESHTKDGVKCLTQVRMRLPSSGNDESGSFLARRATLAKKVAPLKSHEEVPSS
jgi:hypothetical protein